MNIDQMTKITLHEEVLDDLALQSFSLEAEIELLEERASLVREMKLDSDRPSDEYGLNLYLKQLTEQVGRARTNLIVTDNNRMFFQARLQAILEESHE